MVAFNDPYAMLDIKTVEPKKTETDGVVLRLYTPQDGSLVYKEETVMFSQISDGEGKCLRIDSTRRDIYRPGAQESSYIVTSETILNGQTKKIVSTLELSQQGEIVRFIDGAHNTKVGKFIIKQWTRSPLFPAEPVRIDDTWTYDEMVDMRIESWLIKNREQKPYTIKARSTLDSFVLCRNIRCAVIKTVIVKEEEHHVRVLFKNLDFVVRTRVDETTYFDYRTGRIVAQVVETVGQTTSYDPPLTDTSQGQSIIFLQQDQMSEAAT
jgi:hypothetical protein